MKGCISVLYIQLYVKYSMDKVIHKVLLNDT